MIQLFLVGIGALIVVSGVRALLAANPSLSDDARKKKTGVASASAARTLGIVQILLGLAMVGGGLTISLWIPK